MGCPFHWFSKMQRSVTLSSAEAEFFGCMLALKDTLWIRQVLLDLNLLKPGPSLMWCDSKSAVAMAFDPVAFKNSRIRSTFCARPSSSGTTPCAAA